MKKNVVIGLTAAALLIAGCVTGMTGCNKQQTDAHEHEYAWTEKTPAACEAAGVEEYICSCGDIKETRETPPLGHTIGDWEITKEPTCTDPGEEAKKCINCGTISETREAAALGHTEGEWAYTVEPTCTEAGTSSLTCSACGAELETKEAEALGHDYPDEWTVTKEATCTDKGARERVCTRCGDKQSEEVRALGHTFSDWEVVKVATCETDGQRKRVCSVCGKEQIGTPKATGHKYGDWVITKAATCFADGERTRTCSVCKKVEKEVIKSAGTHLWSDWVIEKVSTCMESGIRSRTCTVCGKAEKEYYIDEDNHDWGEWEIFDWNGEKHVYKRTCKRYGTVYEDRFAEMWSIKNGFRSDWLKGLKHEGTDYKDIEGSGAAHDYQNITYLIPTPEYLSACFKAKKIIDDGNLDKYGNIRIGQNEDGSWGIEFDVFERLCPICGEPGQSENWAHIGMGFINTAVISSFTCVIDDNASPETRAAYEKALAAATEFEAGYWVDKGKYLGWY